MKQFIALPITLVVGLLAGWWLFSSPAHDDQSASVNTSGEPEILYWVAPMDASYRRDGPGKSPMGMDLVPVYASDNNDVAGTVSLSPAVINNLGVVTEKASIRSLSNDIEAVGFVAFNQDSLVHVHPRVSGWLEQVAVKSAGEIVTQGQLLYTLYSPELVTAQEELVLAVKRGNQALVRAAKARLNALNVPQDLVTRIEQGGSVSQQVRFYAPASGIVDVLNIRPGFYVEPGKTLMVIGNLDEVWIETEVFERQAAQVKAGQSVTVGFDALPARKWSGKVDYVYPIIDNQTRSLRVRIILPNPEGALKPNMFANVSIHGAGHQQVLAIPTNAVIRTSGQARVVKALGDGKFLSTRVETGQMTPEYTEIIAGLDEGDSVVTQAQFLIDSESAINADLSRISGPTTTEDTQWVGATILSVDSENHTVSARHDPVDAWDWPAMTMDFDVAPSVDISQLHQGLSLHIGLTKSGGSAVISDIHIMQNMDMADDVEEETATVDGHIVSVNADNTLTIARGAIEKWGRGPATLDFAVDDSLTLPSLGEGDMVRFTFAIRNGDFVITAIENVRMDHSAHGGAL